MVGYSTMLKNINKISEELKKKEYQVLTKTKPIHIKKSERISKTFIHQESLSGWGILQYFVPQEVRHAYDFFLMEIDNDMDHSGITIKSVAIDKSIENAICCDITWEKINERNIKISSVMAFNSNIFDYGICRFGVVIDYE